MINFKVSLIARLNGSARFLFNARRRFSFLRNTNRQFFRVCVFSVDRYLSHSQRVHIVECASYGDVSLINRLIRRLTRVLRAQGFQRRKGGFLDVEYARVCVAGYGRFTRANFVRFLYSLTSAIASASGDSSRFFINASGEGAQRNVNLEQGPGEEGYYHD